MVGKFLGGLATGAGFIAVVAVAFAIAWAGDVFTIDKDGALKFAVSDQGKITVGATESYVNLVIQNDEVVAESDNKVDITADVLTVEGIRLENVNVSANIESAGAGGLDTGSELTDRWYYVWVITNNNGTSVNGILTLAPLTPNPPTPPVLPSGYTKKRRVGAVRNYGNNFLSFVQEGNKCDYTNNVGYDVLVSGQAAAYTAVPCATYAPPTSRKLIANLALTLAHTSMSLFYAKTRPTGSGLNAQNQPMLFNPVINQLFTASYVTIVDLNASQQFDYNLNAVPSAGGFTVTPYGYYDRI